MSDIKFSISIPTDSDNFFKLQCPYCNGIFKLSSEEFQASEALNLYCPKCGLTSEIPSFYTTEVIDKALSIGQNYAEEMIHNLFKDLERKSKRSGLKIKAGKKPKSYEPELYEFDDFLVIVNNHCCKTRVKVTELDKWIGIYCSYCGRNN